MWQVFPEAGLAICVKSLKADPRYAKCPRCWRYTGEGRMNFDGLCDPCCRVLVTDYPGHVAPPQIEAAYAAQRRRWGVATRE